MHQRPLYYRDDEKLQRFSIFCRRRSRCCFQAFFYYHLSCNFSGVVPAVIVSPTQNHPLSVGPAKRESAETRKEVEFMRVYLPDGGCTYEFCCLTSTRSFEKTLVWLTE